MLASILGSWLVFFNQLNVILLGAFTPMLDRRMVLDYATPFIVSSLTGILRNRNDRQRGVISWVERVMKLNGACSLWYVEGDSIPIALFRNTLQM
ncbi:MAG: hypothetical protein JRN20_21710 [Nitrososphaerota archaeon]|nr:hypothetical protein [Nitrososphaerota archaeon]